MPPPPPPPHPRAPSVRSVSSHMRRRAGAFSQGGASSGSMRARSSGSGSVCMRVQVEDVDGPGAPTVVLVQKRRGRVSSLPFVAWEGGEGRRDGLGLQVPEGEEREEEEDESRSVESFAPLPMPDFGDEDTFDGLPRVEYTPAPSDHRVRPPVSNSTRRYTTQLKRPGMHSALSTADRLTDKFPISQSVRSLSLKPSDTGWSSVEAFPAALRDAGDLEVESFDRWTAHKWWLFLSVCTVFAAGAAGLACALLTWFRTWAYADVFFIADYDLLVLITLAAALLLFTATVGAVGTLLNSRPLLAVYALLLWPALAALLAVGYTAYKRSAFALDRKLNRAWSEFYSSLGRRALQDALRCCGYASPLHEAAASPTCYARAPLPGCKGALLRGERDALRRVWAAAFAVVPLHLANIIAALLCANHVDRTFGRGVMPRRYRLRGADVVAMRPVVRPAVARWSSGGAYREDRADQRALMGGEGRGKWM